MKLLTVLLAALLATTTTMIAQHAGMPAGMSHDEHLKQMEKDAADHHFILEKGGGSIQVTMKPAADPVVLSEVRGHLKTIAEEFARGDFGKPFQTHDEVPTGVNEMKKAGGAISYRYEDVTNGGAVRISTTDAKALKAVHDFLRYQIAEHRTGDPLAPKK